MSQSVVAASGNKIATSGFVGWSSFLLAPYATITTPLALFNAFHGTQSFGNAKWVVLFVALPIRLCWIYFFFGRWLAYRRFKEQAGAIEAASGKVV